MVGYDWVCNACGSKNEAKVEYCHSCKCHASASVEEIERLRNPDAVKKREGKNLYIKKITTLMYAPFFAVVYGISGRIEVLALTTIVLLVTLKVNSDFIKFVIRDKWLGKTVGILSVSLLGLMILRLYIADDSHLITWIVGGFVLFSFVAYFLLFKSSHGQSAFERYFRDNDS
ncbi:hypothetical protein ACOI22_04295 [Glaciecola sp. 2405UD65-10]|uniref:hypothetical protein n=1 Tax=Glaciecola sp. 2405UD65-10 TaxID=3397244 RepID=UPI003B5A6318